MGRYYNGDIEGKFWFAVQNSDDASFFGGQESEPNYINYDFDKSDMPSIKVGLEKCDRKLGDYKEKLDKFFEDNNGYNEEMIVKKFKITEEKVKELLQWYARRILGEKIKKCVEKNDYCHFEVEL